MLFMRRRSFLTLPFGMSLLQGQEDKPSAPAFIELRQFRLRSGKQVERTTDYLKRGWLPASQRAGVAPIGFFSALVAPESPFILSLTSFPTLSAITELGRKLAVDKDFQAVLEEYNPTNGDVSYMRMDNTMLMGFPSMPSVAVPPSTPDRPPRVFELRTYEAPTEFALWRKIKMFGDGEIAAFRRCGMLPVFFGSALFGRDMPSLTYMLAFDDWAAREKAWSALSKDPGWQKLRATPGLSDAELVSNISNVLLRPLPFSPIR